MPSARRRQHRFRCRGLALLCWGLGLLLQIRNGLGRRLPIVVNDRAYLVDCGPGLVRRAAAAEKNGVAALKATKLNIVFITHLHSDHTLGYPDLIFSPWVLGRKEPLERSEEHTSELQ